MYVYNVQSKKDIISILRFVLSYAEKHRQHSFKYSNNRLKIQMHYEIDAFSE